jgi:hypothetical protein
VFRLTILIRQLNRFHACWQRAVNPRLKLADDLISLAMFPDHP